MTVPFVGTIQLYAFGYAPTGYMLCNGATLPVAGYQPLYSLIGNKFGGGGAYFCLPNLAGADPLEVTPGFMCYYIAYSGIYPVKN